MEQINERIRKEICKETLIALSDNNLLPEYKACKSVQSEIQILNGILDECGVEEEKKQNVLEKYVLKLIPPGTKGVIRGNHFNRIIKNKIEQMKELDFTRFDVCFEQKCEEHITTEIPDFTIREKATNKIIIGMNQLDLWGGGQQLNRGSKYIDNNKHNNENSKLLCVVCNDIQFKSEKNKAYKLFKTGFDNNTLCYLNNLEHIIKAYFAI